MAQDPPEEPAGDRAPSRCRRRCRRRRRPGSTPPKKSGWYAAMRQRGDHQRTAPARPARRRRMPRARAATSRSAADGEADRADAVGGARRAPAARDVPVVPHRVAAATTRRAPRRPVAQRARPAAVDGDGDAGDVGAGAAGQEQEGAVELVELPGPAHRAVAAEVAHRALVAEHVVLGHLRGEPARGDGVDPHPPAGPLAGQLSGQVDDGALAGGVGRLLDRAPRPPCRGSTRC